MFIAIHKKLKKHIKSREEIDEQIITMDVERNGATIVIIGAYAPSDDADVKVKDEFYNRLRDVLVNVSQSEEIFLCTDFNARVGREEEDAVLGRYGEERTNNNGERLIDLCQSLNLRIINGFYRHKNIYKYTWEQPKKKLRSIIDYFMQTQNTRLQTNDVRVYHSAECGSDNYLVVAKIIIHYRRTRQPERDEGRESFRTKKYKI